MKSKIKNPTKEENKARSSNVYSPETNIKRANSMLSTKRKKYFEALKEYKPESKYVKDLVESGLNANNEEIGLALISSFILTDGWITKRIGKGLELGFSNRNNELINSFNDTVFTFFKHLPSSCKLQGNGQTTSRFVASWHQEFIRKIEAFCFFEGKKTSSNLKRLDKKVLSECFRIALSCDGYVSWHIESLKYSFNQDFYYNRLRPCISLGCSDKSLREEWKTIADQIGLKFGLKKDRILTYSWTTLKEFLNIGGFLDNVYIGDDSYRFTGMEKNAVLSRLIKYNELKPTNIKSKDNMKKKLNIEIRNFIKDGR